MLGYVLWVENMNYDAGQIDSIANSHKNEILNRNDEANNKDTEEVFKVVDKHKDRY